MEMEGGKAMKKRQQVTKVQYLTSMNVIELSFDEGLGVGCRSEGHANIRFPKLYVLPCSKTLRSPYLKKSLMISLLVKMKLKLPKNNNTL